MVRRISFLLAASLCAFPVAGLGAESGFGTVEGRVVRGALAGAQWTPTRMVVYLVPVNHKLPPYVSSKNAVVAQKNAAFLPDFLVVAAGETVEFPNEDSVYHNVYSMSKPKQFDLDVYMKGVQKTVTFDKPGLVTLLCSLHENMKSFIYVAPNQYFAVPDEQGNFSITNVPPGLYEVRTWHSILPDTTEFLTVSDADIKAGHPVHVEVDLAKLLKKKSKKP